MHHQLKRIWCYVMPSILSEVVVTSVDLALHVVMFFPSFLPVVIPSILAHCRHIMHRLGGERIIFIIMANMTS